MMELTAAVRLVSSWLEAEPAPRRSDDMHRSGVSGRVICLHEGSHAVIAHRFAIEITQASVCFAAGGSGAVDYRPAGDAAFALACANLAGIIAELRVGVSPARQAHLARSTDVAWARANVARAGVPNAAVVTATAAAVLAHWDAIRRCADVLQACGTVTGDTVGRICEAPT